MKVGYARVSTKEQQLDIQIDQLEEFGCEKIWKEKKSAKTDDRPELKSMIQYVRKGDVIVVYSLSRLARSVKDLISIVDELGSREIGLISLMESWVDTTTSYGKLLLTIFGGIAEFERELISERTKDGLKSARARGRIGGRPKVNQIQINRALKLYDMKTLDVREICEMTGISKATLYRYLKRREVL